MGKKKSKPKTKTYFSIKDLTFLCGIKQELFPFLYVIRSQVLLRSVWVWGRKKEISISNTSVFRRAQIIIRVIRVRNT